MFSHITVGVSDLDAAAAFYDAILLPLGLRQREVTPDNGPAARCWIIPGQNLPRFYAYQPFDRRPASAGNGSMVAFLAADEQQVRQAYAAGMQAGGRSEGEPGERAHYGKGYFGAYLRDPDGNKVHLVYRGDLAAE
ncbi:Predicted enzyme related to lactoylglutathione lyase [Serratia entomophila]|uniref:VOC family protein n=1 Tax=Serratia entomophila TaxID=42906 RepID=UPI001F33D4FB|nr:VOC family protein [Serratia entomophila]UIW20612.1 VOC family protein [Serratia entomophila]CAI0717172.1 Predicted enzyme related to lactoylglutathione lyase [Serratia entomophila]CAI0846794.1 Predicted enzyme related to lactoylglutathione lyase [Serratia entomophila]CAI0863551.1 Predicted enzyme related to lactoylglutathione lyase [Serratia entomophila]CAI0883661.1 Predicted enzyme related to lactoylglutathione lyase [Serratia entomophila]